MEAKHTPGPWFVQDGDRFSMEMVITSQSRIDESMAPICEMDVDYEGPHGVEQHANAQLIATVPELLEVLIEVSATLSWLAFGECRAFHDRRIMNAAEATGKAKAAITKATS